MISIFSPEAFSDYLDKDGTQDRSNNGDIVLQPTSCELSVELGGTWELKLIHSYDDEGRYTYLQKGAVIKCPAKVAREQESSNQLFRILNVKPGLTSVEVTAYPVAMESIYETPISYKEFEDMTAEEVVDELNSIINDNKYTVVTDISSDKTYSTYIENSNLQEYLNGSQDSTFVNAYGGEVIYDNYTYRIVEAAGNISDNSILYAKNLVGLDIEESTVDMVTRIYPVSSEGYEYLKNEINYIDSSRIRNYPFVYAKSVKYDDVVYVEEIDESSNEPASAAAKTTKAMVARLKTKVQQLSKEYLDKARQGEWDHSDIDARGYLDEFHDPHGGAPIPEKRNRYCLPYGYLFWSYTDVIGLLIQKTIGVVFDKEKDKQVYDILSESVKDGFKWCEEEGIPDYRWDWIIRSYYNDEFFSYIGNFDWQEDQTGKWYGDGNGHYIRSGWVEDDDKTHKWVGDDGYYISQHDDDQKWSWHTTENGMWYGRYNETTGQYNQPMNQYMYVSENKNWYWFDENGYYVAPDGERRYYGTEDLADYLFATYWKVGDSIYWFNENGTIDDIFNYIDDYTWHEEEEDSEDEDANKYTIKTTTVKTVTVSVEAGSSTKTTTTVKSVTKLNEDTDETFTIETTETETSDMESAAEETKSETEESTSEEETKVTKSWYGDGKGHFLKNCWVEKDKNTHYWVNADGYVEPVYNDTTEWDWIQCKDTQHDAIVWQYGSTDDNTAYSSNKARGQYIYVTDNSTWYWFDSENGYMVSCWKTTAEWKWRKDSIGYWYGDGAGMYMAAQWYKIDSRWFFFDSGGYADTYTDDFKKVDKTETTNNTSATYQENRDGISVQSTTTTSEETAVYDENREGVKAWLQDQFVNEVLVEVKNIKDDLQTALNERLEYYANYDLSKGDTPALSIKVDFSQLYGLPGYEDYSFLKDYYLGDWVRVYDTKHQVSTVERLTGMTYNCISDEVKDVEIGYAVNTFVKDVAKLSVKSTIKEYFP